MERKSSVYERFSQAQVDRFKHIFRQFDTDGNGYIDEQELHDVMGRLGRELQPGEARKYIEMVDVYNTGVIYFDEFLQLLEMQQQEAEALQQYKDLFRNVFNRSGSGGVSEEELRHGMLTLGHKLTDEEVHEMLYEADQDDDRRLSFEEFAHILTRVQTEEKPISKRGWDHETVVRIFGMWTTILEEAPKLAQKNSMVTRCAKPMREFRRPSRIVEQKQRHVSHTTKILQPEIGSCGPNDIVEVDGVDADGAQVVFTDCILINVDGLVIRGGGGDPKKRPRIEVSSKQPAVTMRAKFCFLDNFEIINHGPGPAIQIDQGFPDVMNCDVSGAHGGMLIRNRAHASVRSCSFHDSTRGYGIQLQESRALIEKCTFSNNSDAGVVVERSSNPWISECEFSKGKGCGVVFVETASGVLCHCDINQNGCPGVLITGGANPILWKNEVHHGDAAGISVQDGGRGLIEENDLHHNADHEIEIRREGNPVIRKNALHDGAGSGISVESGGTGTIEHNNIFNYALAGVYIGNGGAPTVSDNVIVAPEDLHGTCGVSVAEGSGGRVTDNMMVGWAYQPRQSLAGGCALHVGGKNDVSVSRNIARKSEDECRAEKMVMSMGKHDLRTRKKKAAK